MSESRSAGVSIQYNGKKVSTKLYEYLKAFTYTDVASGESDSISLTLANVDKRWLGKWIPHKGDSLTANTFLKNWIKDNDNHIFKCGKFTLDEYSFSGRPLIVSIGGLSVPVTESFKSTNRSKTWKDITLEAIAKEIASNASIKLYYDAHTIKIASIEQSEQTDSDFLYSLCKDYGLAMKVYSNKLVIFDEATYESKKSVAVIDEKDMISWSYNTTLTRTYTGAKISYTDPKTKKDISVKVGDGKRILKVTEKADSKADAELKALAKVNNANKAMTTMKVVIMANTKIVASSNVTISGLSKLNGKYAVDKVIHSVGSGYKMTLQLRKIQERIGVNSYSKKTTKYLSSKTSGTGDYVVKKGDTLRGISKQFYGSANDYTKIYQANKELIEQVAKEHGMPNSSDGHWIWPGTELIIP